MDLNWKAYNAVNKRVQGTLCKGEVDTLTGEEVIKINMLLQDLDAASKELYDFFEIARNRFKNKT